MTNQQHNGGAHARRRLTVRLNTPALSFAIDPGRQPFVWRQSGKPADERIPNQPHDGGHQRDSGVIVRDGSVAHCDCGGAIGTICSRERPGHQQSLGCADRRPYWQSHCDFGLALPSRRANGFHHGRSIRGLRLHGQLHKRRGHSLQRQSDEWPPDDGVPLSLSKYPAVDGVRRRPSAAELRAEVRVGCESRLQYHLSLRDKCIVGASDAGSWVSLQGGHQAVRAGGYPLGPFLYASSAAALAVKNVTGFAINSATGALAQISRSPFTSDLVASSVAIEPSGRFLYTANVSDIIGFLIDPAQGSLTTLSDSPFAANAAPIYLAPDGEGRGLFAVNLLSSDVLQYAINPVSGAAEPVGPPIAAGAGPRAAVVDPSGRFLYVANADSSNVPGFLVDATAQVSPIQHSPFSASNSPHSIAVDPFGRFVYTAPTPVTYPPTRWTCSPGS